MLKYKILKHLLLRTSYLYSLVRLFISFGGHLIFVRLNFRSSLFVCSFVRLFVCSFVRLFVCSYMRSFVRSFP